MYLTCSEITDLVQELCVIPPNRWVRQKPFLNPQTLQEEEQQYRDEYTLEYKEYHVNLDAHYNGATSGTVNISFSGRNNGHGEKKGKIQTIRKDILIRAGQIPTAVAELYDRISQYYNSE